MDGSRQPASVTVDLLTYFAVHSPPVPEWYMDESGAPSPPNSEYDLDSWSSYGVKYAEWNESRQARRTYSWPWHYARWVLDARPIMEVGK